ncbi:MAG: tautomerase family protein [Alphaproteobacteria bacterium]|jgi:4-oxalocrotonate tautomerase|nr:tautomerase family protein [Alphaproteobacteria bacterium]
MPHIYIKLAPGTTDAQKQEFADMIVTQGTRILGHKEEVFSVAFEEIPYERWKKEVYDVEIVPPKGQMFKKPGYEL